MALSEQQRERRRARVLAWQKANPEKANAKSRRWQEANREKCRAISRAWNKANPEKIRAARWAWVEANPEKARTQAKRRREVNRERNRKAQNDWHHKNYSINPSYRIKKILRVMMARLKKLTPWSVKLRDMLGCDQDWFMAWMEIQFKPGMSWENQSQWHIDHIRPISSFDLNDLRQLRKVNHFTNLQPLWAEENMRKHAKWDRGIAGLSSGEP